MMDIGNKIRKLRYRTSLTQEQLADMLKVSAQAVSKWENAVAMPFHPSCFMPDKLIHFMQSFIVCQSHD